MRIISVLAIIIYGILTAFECCMLVRAICSWVPSFRESKIYSFTLMITEPITGPVRELFMRFDWVRRCPLDISFFVVYILVTALASFAYAFI